MIRKVTAEEEQRQNDVIARAQAAVVKYGNRYAGPEIRDLMDLISGVSSYNMRSSTPQGYIHAKVLRDRIETNHVIDADTMISKFWEGVWKALPTAVERGEIVKVLRRNLTGAEAKGEGEYVEVVTKMSPLNRIRSYAVGYARRFQDESFKRRLKQQCLDCHKIMGVGMTKEYDNGCPKCGAAAWTGEVKAGFLQKRTRVCGDCGHRRATHFKRICGRVSLDEDKNPILDTGGEIQIVDGCKSENVILIQAEEFFHDGQSDGPTMESMADEVDPESSMVEREGEGDVLSFVQAAEDALPRDPGDPRGDSKNRKILRILTDPREGAEVCKGCRTNAGMVCGLAIGAECRKGNTESCGGACLVNPKECCGATSFSIEVCLNYSRKIGEFMGFTTTLANRRVAKVRDHTRKFARDNTRRYATARYLAAHLN